jgi:hypothetical protein
LLTHAHAPEQQDHHPTRFPRGPLAGALAVVLAGVLAAADPAPVVRTGGMERVAYASMSDAALTDRAEWDPDYARALGHRMIKDFGWPSVRRWRCLKRLWNFESSWRVHADNPYSSAYGIPQALPGKKMATAGDHWRRNAQTQIRWGLRYIRSRYSGTCGALHHSRTTGWY